MIRRFVYDTHLGRVVEVVAPLHPTRDAATRYADEHGSYMHQFTREAGDTAAARLRDAALDRADRRVWAHERRGDERRWAE